MKWSIYNQFLVRKDEAILKFNVINNWDTELKEMNKDKIGLGAISLSKYIPSLLLLLEYAKVISSSMQVD